MEIVPALRLVRRTTRERRHPETEQHQLTTRRFDETAERSEAEIRSSFDRRDLRLRQPHRVREGLLGQPAHAAQLRQPDLVLEVTLDRRGFRAHFGLGPRLDVRPLVCPHSKPSFFKSARY
jgi:hypothetical protein